MLEYLKRKPHPKDCCFPEKTGNRFYENEEFRERFERVFTSHNEFNFPISKVVSYDKTDLKYFSQKVSVCNNAFEFFHYSNPISLNRKVFIKDFYYLNKLVLLLLEFCTEEGLKKRKVHAWSSAKRLRSIVFGNFEELDKFISLTFDNKNDFDIFNLKICNKRKERYIAKLLKLKPDLKYVVVPEYQKRGAVHFHIVCNLPYISKDNFHKLWVYGFSGIGAVGNINKRFHYLAKYLTKGFIDPDFFRLRRYYVSNSCIRPTSYYEQASVEIEQSIELSGLKPIVEQTYTSSTREDIVSLERYVAYKVPKILPVPAL